MKSFYTKLTLVSAIAIGVHGIAGAQGWFGCIDPANKTPISTNAIWYTVQDEIFSGVIGAAGTITYGGSTGPCFAPSAVTNNFNGRIGLGSGPTGSVQSSFDNSIAFTFGWPLPAGSWDYTNISEDGALYLVGANAPITSFQGASDRYAYVEETVNTNLDVRIRLDVIADAARVSYTITNNDTTNHGIGLWYGAQTAIGGAGQQSAGFPNNGPANKPVYIVAPGYKPITTERRMYAPTIPLSSQFPLPNYVDFDYGQNNSYGLQVLLGPSPATVDSTGQNSDCTQVDELAIGDGLFLIGADTGGDVTFPDVMFGSPVTITQPDGQVLTEKGAGDVAINGFPAYIQKYYEQTVAAAGTRQIVCYYRGTWGTANYSKPYSVSVDAPTVMGIDPANPPNLLQPAGGYDIRVWVDNTRGFSSVDQTISLKDVSVTIALPAGVNLVAGDAATKLIPIVTPANSAISHVDFHVLPNGTTFGQLPYTVTIAPNPGPTKVINGIINVPSTPVLTLHQGLNLVSTPFNFTDSSWTNILNLQSPSQYQAFNFDPVQNGYVPAVSDARGKGTWIYSSSEIGQMALNPANNPQEPTDMYGANTTLTINLQPGWNIIADPYPFDIPLGGLVGVDAQNPNQSYKWLDLVNQGYVNGALAYYDPTQSSGYSYIQQLTDNMVPNQGYWIFVNGTSVLTLNYPTVDQEYVNDPNALRSTTAQWPQTANNWRLQLSVRNNGGADSQNFLGVVPTQQKAQQLQVMKPPTLPRDNNVSLAIEGTVAGRSYQMAQALSTTTANQTYKVDVTAAKAGSTTVTWPNLSSLPKNLQFTLVDTATGVTRSMNQSSGYTFTAQANTTRQLKVEVSTGTLGAATIGNVIVTRPSRSPNAPFTIMYNLASAATTSVRILAASGQTVFNVTAGRADAMGTNSVSWDLKDNANRNVAPGVYRVEITADTANGQRVRKIVTINVVR